MTANCQADHFLDEITFICLHCRLLCNQHHHTPEACKTLCPNYVQTPTTVTSFVSMTTPSLMGSGPYVPETAFVISLSCMLVLLVVMVLSFLLLYLYDDKILSHCLKSRQLSMPKNSNGNIPLNSIPNEHDSLIAVNSCSQDICETKKDVLSSCKNDLSDEMQKQDERIVNTCEKTSREYTRNNSNDNINDCLSLTSVPSITQKNKSGYHLVNDQFEDTRRPNEINQLDGLHSSKAFVCKTTENARTNETTPKTSEQPTGNQSHMSHCEQSDTEEESLDIQLLSCSDGCSQAEQQQNQERYTTGPNSTRWNDIMKLYNEVEAQLTRFPWIVACMISNDHLEVVVDLTDTNMDVTSAYNKLCANLTPGLSDNLVMTLEGASLELCHGASSGRAAAIRTVEGKRRRAMITLCVSLDRDTYIFSVAHFLDDEETCCSASFKNCSKAAATLEARINSTETENLSNIKNRFWDMALLKTEYQMHLNNNFVLHKAQKAIHVEIMTSDLYVPRILNEKALIHASHGEFKARIHKIHLVKQSHNKFKLNLIELKGCGDIVPGDSGSLVTYYPDENYHTYAFAYVIGVSHNDRDVVMAAPLWPSVTEVCQQLPRALQWNVLNAIKLGTTEDMSCVDSAYVSQSVV